VDPLAPGFAIMASWTSLLAAYVLGGITFIPLVIISTLALGFYALPERSQIDSQATDADEIVLPGDDTDAFDAAKKAPKEEHKPRRNSDLDVAAGYFAVCREYTPMGINAKPIERPTPVGSTTVASPSPSVYQTMYRSIFERKAVPGPIDNNSNTSSQRPKKAGNVFYVVLRSVDQYPLALNTFTNWLIPGTAISCSSTTTSKLRFDMSFLLRTTKLVYTPEEARRLRANFSSSETPCA
jgi:hypothetical protein